MDEIQNWVQWATLIAVVFIGIGSFTWFVAPVIDCPTCQVLPNLEVPEVNLTGVEGRLTEIEVTLDKDDNWEKEAEALATDEWEDRDYKDIFNFLEDEFENIDDRDDIIYVREDKATTFTGMDADEKDAIITQYIKVKYEDASGENQYVYLTISTEIEENEIEEQEIEETGKTYIILT